MNTLRSLIFLTAASCAPLMHAEPLSDAVLQRYEQMLEQSPESGTSFDKVYQHYLETDGLDALEKRWMESSSNPDAKAKASRKLLVGLLQERRGKTDAARASLLAAAEHGAGWRAWASLGNLEARSGRLKEAVAAYRKALEEKPPSEAAAKLYRGLALSQQRLLDNDGAVETWRAYAEASPGDPFVLEEAGDALLNAERFDEARSMFEKLAALPDADAARRLSAQIRLAEVDDRQGRRDKALARYNEALAAAGSASWLQKEIRARIERMFRAEDDLPGLVKYYDQRLKDEPGDVEAALRLSEVLIELRRSDAAIAALQAAAEKAPDRRDIRLRWADTLLTVERAEEARAILAAMNQAKPNDPIVLEKLGTAEWGISTAKDATSPAVATWRKLVTDDTDPAAWQRLGEIYRRHQLRDETVDAYQRALGLAPDAADRRERLAEYLIEIDRRNDALEVLDGMVADGRASSETTLRLAKIQRRYGEEKAALATLESGAQFPERAFDRLYLKWQLEGEAENWAAAEQTAENLASVAGSDSEFDRAGDAVVRTQREMTKTVEKIRSLLERHRGNPGKFSERDYRLLFLLAIDSDDTGTASFALIEGLKAYPNSVGLWKLEQAYARRETDVERQIAAILRLRELEPKRASDWSFELARTYRNADRMDEAIATAKTAVEASPASADAWLAYADILFAAGRQDEGIRSLSDAVKVSDAANRILLRLADAYASAGNLMAARETLDQAFEAEESLPGKLQLMNRVASAYLQEGKIDELIARFRERQKAEEGGWRYALFLAEIYTLIDDRNAAMQELDKALVGKPDDVNLLRRLQSLSQDTGNSAASLRYARRLAEVDPSKANRASLANALAADGRFDETLDVIRQFADEFLTDPSAWQLAISALQSEGRTEDLSAMLEAQAKSRPDDWRTRLALAELLMRSGSDERAETLLWSIVDLEPEPVTLPAPVAANPAARGIRVYGFPGANPVTAAMQQRANRVGPVLQRGMNLLSGNPDPMMGYSRGGRRNYGMAIGQPTTPKAAGSGLNEARDDAIVYLACIAVKKGREQAFVDALGNRMKSLPVAERLSVYGLLQCPDRVFETIEELVDSGKKDPDAASYALGLLQNYAAMRRNEGSMLRQISEERIVDLSNRLLAILSDGRPDAVRLTQYYVLMNLGRTEDAKKLASEILASVDEGDVNQLQVALSIAVQNRDFDRVVKFAERLQVAMNANGARSIGLEQMVAQALLASDKHRSRGAAMALQSFRSPNVFAAYGSRMNPNIQNINWQQLRDGNTQHLFPFPTAYVSDAQLNVLRQFTGGSNEAGSKEFAKQLAAARAEKTDPSLELGGIYLTWFTGKKDDAAKQMKDFLAKHPDDAVRINYALMLDQLARPDEAEAALAGIASRSGVNGEFATRMRFAIAIREDKSGKASGNDNEKNVEATRQAALQLASLNLPEYEQRELVQKLKELGLTEAAEKLQKRNAKNAPSGSRARQTVEILRESISKNDRDGSLALARAMLSSDPLGRNSRNDMYPRQEALRALKQFGELAPYIAGLTAQREQTPKSARLNALLAEAHQVDEPKAAIPYFRALAELRPSDTDWQLRLAQLLTQSQQWEESMRLYDKLLAEKPAAVFAQGTTFIEPYRQQKAHARLMKAMLAAPAPPPDPLNINRQNFSGVYTEVARELQRARPPIETTDLLMRGIAWDPDGGSEIRPRLARLLARAGRQEEAGKIVEEALFPTSRSQDGVALLVMNRSQRGNIWLNATSYGNGAVEIQGLRLLKLAAELGLLESLKPRIEKIPASPDGTDPAVLAGIAARDPLVLPKIQEKVDAVNKSNLGPGMYGGGNQMIWRAIANNLLAWPAGRDLGEECLDVAITISRKNGPDYYGISQMTLQKANVALENNKPEDARAALEEWVTNQRDMRRTNRGSIDYDSNQTALKLMAKLGMSDTFKAWVAEIRGDPNVMRNSGFVKTVQAAENELALQTGKGGDIVAVLATQPAKEGEVISWEIRPAGFEDESDRSLWMKGDPVRKLGGDYTLDVYFGASDSAMKRLFSKPVTDSRGSWSGPLPKAQGVLRAVLRKGDEFLLGSSVAVATGAMVFAPDRVLELANAKMGVAPGWASVASTENRLIPGAPFGDGKAIRLSGEWDGEQQLVSERIPVNPKAGYLIGGAFRFPQNGYARVEWKFFDRSGKEVGGNSPSGNFQNDRWNIFSQRLGEGANSWNLPQNAAFLEFQITYRGEIDLQGVFVRERPKS